MVCVVASVVVGGRVVVVLGFGVPVVGNSGVAVVVVVPKTHPAFSGQSQTRSVGLKWRSPEQLNEYGVPCEHW